MRRVSGGGISPALLGTIVWVAFVLFAIVVVVRSRYTTDLSAFLPRAPTESQRLLVDQLRDGLASRMIIVAIEGSDSAARARISTGMAATLRPDPRFTTVQNGDAALAAQDQKFLFEHRYLLSESVTPQRYTADGLHDAIQDTLDLLASPAGMLAKSLLPQDPTGEMVQIIGQLSSGGSPRTVDGVWSSRDGQRALIVLQTRASGSDTDGQQQAIEAIQHAFAQAVNQSNGLKTDQDVGQSPKLRMTGSGVFAVAIRAKIKQQVVRLSTLSMVVIVVLLLAVYRSLPALVLGLVPVATGALAGITAVSLGFGSVHGITLGFGSTLIGEAVDYSIYLFIQSRASGDWTRDVWPTLHLGMLTSVVGFASLLPSGFPGLQQLGLYSIAGLIAAALVTRYVLPHWLPRQFAIRDVAPLGVGFAAWVKRASRFRAALWIIPIVTLLVLYGHRDALFNHNLADLSPVPLADQDFDDALRADLGAPDVRFLVVVSAPNPEAGLRATEKVNTGLETLIDQHVIGGFESPTYYIPSRQTQLERRASLPSAEALHTGLAQALIGLPLRIERLQPFERDAQIARDQPLITRDSLQGTSLAAGYDALVVVSPGSFRALLPMRPAVPGGDIDLDRVQRTLEKAAPGAVVALDVTTETDKLYSNYLTEAVRLSLAGFMAVVILLAIAVRSAVRVVRIVTPLALAVLTVAAGLVILGHSLTILHVIGMLLIVAVGSNYALFFDRRTTAQAHGSAPLTLASLLVANVATVVGFGVLAFSTVPVLSSLGSTVAPGALLALLFSALLARTG